jgi:H+/Cl- antiporter ClcA
VAAAFNPPIAGVVVALEELAKSFERRTHTTVILVVVIAGIAAYALQGDYAYFGVLNSGSALGSAWLAAPLVGLVGGLCGGLFAKALVALIGPLAARAPRVVRRPLRSHSGRRGACVGRTDLWRGL